MGDPSGKDASRQLLTQQTIDANIAGISAVFERFLAFGDGPTDAVLVNNDDWLSSLEYLSFLREYGRHFTINRMLSFESVKQRLERESPLSFLEFNYMILQAFDFLMLHRRLRVALQFGGSDQWGNIINGVELGRRVDGAQLYGLTAPLLTTADGKKMGKTADGAVWLNADLLSPYDYWQFWRNADDADVGRFLRIFTELPREDIERLEALPGAQINEAKVVLADEATSLLHGPECLAEVKQTAAALFASGGARADASALPRVALSAAEAAQGVPLVDLFVRLDLGKSKSEVRRLVSGGGARLNDEKVADAGLVVTPPHLAAAVSSSCPRERRSTGSSNSLHSYQQSFVVLLHCNDDFDASEVMLFSRTTVRTSVGMYMYRRNCRVAHRWMTTRSRSLASADSDCVRH